MKNYFPMIAITLVVAFFSFCTSEIAPEDGADLAQKYCSNCHLYPTPEILDRVTWEQYVLPRMAAFMGVYDQGLSRSELIENNPGGEKVLRAGTFPEQPTISSEKWKAIKEFYLSKAPKQLSVPQSRTEKLDLFEITYPDLFLSPPSTTFIKLTDDGLQFSDANKGLLLILDKNLQVTQQARCGEGLVHIEEDSLSIFLTMMGSFSPTDEAKGYILKLSKNQTTAPQKIITNLQRPVHADYHDFNNDGLTDILICEFGKWTGALNLYFQQRDGSFQKKTLLKRSGAIRSEVRDFDRDGWIDIMALFGQGDEKIQLFKNQDGQKFKSEVLLRFHPSMGSSFFSLFDYNNDGLEDIIYTAGDNADYPPVLKPYHGIYIFEQYGDFKFQEKKFLHLNGAYKAIPADFDQDGDLDIAAISFFPDYEKIESHDFFLFENEKGVFNRTGLNLNNKGRWLTMDAGDLNGDGKIDLALGSLSFEVPDNPDQPKIWVNNGLPFVVLKNK